MTLVKVYVAAKWQAGPRIRKIAATLGQIPGVTIVSTWHGRDGTAQYEESDEARHDLWDLYKASMLFLDTLDESNTGGREVEWGYCLRGREGMPGTTLDLILVGPRRNVFHHLDNFHFETWHEAIEWLTKRQTQ